jgi:hypothetical protein
VAASSPIRKTITRSSATVDHKLRDDPATQGRYHSEGLYSIDVSPLRAYYTVDEMDRLVTVTDVSLIV